MRDSLDLDSTPPEDVWPVEESDDVPSMKKQPKYLTKGCNGYVTAVSVALSGGVHAPFLSKNLEKPRYVSIGDGFS